MAAREDSINRERETLNRAQSDFAAEAESDRAALRENRARWEQERTALRADLEHRGGRLAELEEKLTARETRLENMRQEMEETLRQSLETRLAIEEAWAAYSKAAGLESAQSGVEEARQALNKQLDALHAELESKRGELAEEMLQFEHAEAALESERETLANWVSERDQTLADWENQLQRHSQSLESREFRWRSLRDQWTEEKLEAEGIIRDLLSQLEGQAVGSRP
jgi:chromosome segregation ATPase